MWNKSLYFERVLYIFIEMYIYFIYTLSDFIAMGYIIYMTVKYEILFGMYLYIQKSWTGRAKGKQKKGEFLI